MNKVIACLAVFLMLFGMAGIASATMVSAQWTDTWAPDDGPVYFGRTGYRTFSYTHNLLDDNFILGQDTIDDYTLTISLTDNTDPSQQEWAYINLPGIRSDRFVEVNYDDITAGSSILGLVSLNDDGILEVTIRRLWGDFYLTGSTLVADGQTDAAVPLPASVLLLASGLIGLGAFRRKVTK